MFSRFGFFYPEDSMAPIAGFDLDGHSSTVDAVTETECAHDDYPGGAGETGIDYQFLRVVDTFPGLQRDQIVDGVMQGAIKNGAMTLLLELEGVDDTLNDDSVGLTVFSSEEAPLLDADGNVAKGGTLGVHPDTTFHSASVPATLTEGVLMAGPVDLNFDFNIQIVREELIVREAMLRVELDADGNASGLITGYWDVQDIRTILGVPTTENGNAAGFELDEFMDSLNMHADLDPDPDTGLCRALSTSFAFEAVPTFIVR